MGKDYCSEYLIIMPKQITDLKVFTNYFVSDQNKKKASKKEVEKEKNHPKTVFQNRMIMKDTKFKLRTAKQLLTYKTADPKTVKRILGSLPPQLHRVEIKKKTQSKRKAKKN